MNVCALVCFQMYACVLHSRIMSAALERAQTGACRWPGTDLLRYLRACAIMLLASSWYSSVSVSATMAAATLWGTVRVLEGDRPHVTSISIWLRYGKQTLISAICRISLIVLRV